MTANFDPEVLQWPGGSLIACFLWVCVTARSIWPVGTGDSAVNVDRYLLSGSP